jgi:hypothetical protein
MEFTKQELESILAVFEGRAVNQQYGSPASTAISKCQTELRRMNLARLGDDIKKQNGISEENAECLKLLNGCEVWSQHYEGCVCVSKGRVILDGKIIDTLDTDEKIDLIWSEYCVQESVGHE